MNKAVFLDRDGVINVDRNDYTWKIDDFIVLPDVIRVLKAFRDKGFLLIVITNQGGIAKKIYEHRDVALLHEHLCALFKMEQIELTEIYYCPHHIEIEKCICRKPESVLLEKALARFNIDASQSYFIGDRERDTEAAIGAGVIPVKIETNTSLMQALDVII